MNKVNVNKPMDYPRLRDLDMGDLFVYYNASDRSNIYMVTYSLNNEKCALLLKSGKLYISPSLDARVIKFEKGTEVMLEVE